MTRRHRNFQDPVGLVRRMLASGDPAARAALGREALRYVARPLDWTLGRWERRRMDRAGGVETPVVLIVGAPRTGSTLLYQVLTAHLPVSYPSNFTELFSRAPITATVKLGRLARRKVTYRSYYGNTASLGSPNDAFSIWNRWLGEDRYQVPDHISPERAANLRSFFAAWEAAFGRPFLNKNNRNTAAVRLLATALPTARFIIIRRDPLFVAQSLLEARQTVQGDPYAGWGLAANQEPNGTDRLADVADQVLRIDSMLEAQLAEIDPARVLEVGYTELCAEPAQVVGRVAVWLGMEAQQLEQLEPFVSTDRAQLSATEFGRLQEEIRMRFPPD